MKAITFIHISAYQPDGAISCRDEDTANDTDRWNLNIDSSEMQIFIWIIIDCIVDAFDFIVSRFIRLRLRMWNCENCTNKTNDFGSNSYATVISNVNRVISNRADRTQPKKEKERERREIEWEIEIETERDGEWKQIENSYAITWRTNIHWI